MRKIRRAQMALALCCVGLLAAPIFVATECGAQQNDSFIIVAVPDQQELTESYPQIFDANMQWIGDNAVAQNIKFVIFLGDIVNRSDYPVQWQNADAAVQMLDLAQVPYVLAIGNHDYDNNQGGMDDSLRDATTFNAYFGPRRYAGYTWYPGINFPSGSNENYYVTVPGTNLLILVLEFYPRDIALNWAASIVEANPDKEIIIATHAYEFNDNTREDDCDPSGPSVYHVTDGNQGEQIWSKFVSRHKNIIMVVNGHFAGTARQTDFALNGNLVNQMMMAHQQDSPGGGGYLRILKFEPSSNQIEATTYSPYLNQYKSDADNQFVLPYHAPPPALPSGAANIRGIVRSTDCTAISGASIGYPGGSAVTDSSGYYNLTVPSPGSYVLSADASADASSASTVDVRDGYVSQQDFYLAAPGTDFTLAVTPGSQSVSPGKNVTYSVTATPVNAFMATLDLAVEGLPAGTSAGFVPTTISASGSSTLTVAASSDTPPGSYPLTVSGKVGSVEHSVSATLVISEFAPTITAISPASGPTSGGTTVTITGTNFASGATVKFGDTAATDVLFIDSTSLQATAPASASAGTVSITVTNPDDQSTTLSSQIFNLLVNPGFEDGTGGWIANSAGTHGIVASSSQAHSGTYYAQVSTTGSPDPIYYAADESGNTYFPVTPGDLLTFGGWAYRVSGNGYGRWKLQVLDSAKITSSYPSPTPDNVTAAAWVNQQGTYTVPAGKAYIRLYCELYQSTTSSSVRFDDAVLTRKVVAGFTYTPGSQTVSVSVSPSSVSLPTSATQQFTASVTGTTNTSVLWSVNGAVGGNGTVGTISPSGLYTAPATVPNPAQLTVTATSAADTSKSASAQVTIAPGISVSVSPAAVSVAVSATQQFTASVTGTTNTAVTWSVNGTVGGNSTVGTISAFGSYTAPATVPKPPQVSVTATSAADGGKSASAAVTIKKRMPKGQ